MRDITTGEQYSIVDLGLSFSVKYNPELLQKNVILGVLFSMEGMSYLDSSIPLSLNTPDVDRLVEYLTKESIEPVLKGLLAFYYREDTCKQYY